MNSQQIVQDIKALGISAAAVFPTADIKFDTVFRTLCARNVCGRYGKNYKCPPLNGEPEVLMAEAKSYTYAVLIQTIYDLEDSYDFEGMVEGEARHSDNIQRALSYIKTSVPHTALLALGAGGCKICERCGVLDDIPCRFPENAISSVEGYCMDVAHMTNTHGLHYINGPDTVSYVGVFLVR